MTTKEAYKELESAHFLKDKDLVQPPTSQQLETRRRIVDFIREIGTARFMLAMSFKQPGIDPYLDLFEEKDFNNEFKHNFYRQYYLYSAVIWYHNSFDLILQCLCFYHELYGDKHFSTKLVKETLKKCDIILIKSSLYNGDDHNPLSTFKKKHKYVFDIAKGLKHRQYISNDSYLLYAEAFEVTDSDYSSKDTMVHVDLKVLQEELMTFHKDIIALAKELLIPIHNSIDNILEED